MTLFSSLYSVRKWMETLSSKLLPLFLSLNFMTEVEAAIPVPPGADVTGNPLVVNEYLDSLTIYPCSDLAHVIGQLPIEGDDFVEALDKMHPALLQDLTFATDENMQSARYAMVGRNAYLRHGRCLKFIGLYSDQCNIGPSSLYVTPIGVFNNRATTGRLQGYRSSTPGIIIGVDSQPNKNTIVGFGVGYSYTDLHWKDSYGNADCHTGYFGVYGSSIHDCFFADAAVLGSYEFYKTKRKITFKRVEDNFNDFYEVDDNQNIDRNCPCREPCDIPCHCEIDRNPRSRFRGYAILSHIGLGARFKVCGLNLVPFAAIDYDFVDQDGHREYEGRSLDLRVKANHAHLLRTEFGLSASSCIPYNCAWFRPSVTVSYMRKSVLQGDKFRGSFVKYKDTKFNVRGTDKTIDLVCPGFGLEIQFSSQWIMSFNYDAELSRQHITQRTSCRFQRAY
jgi:hypothetical protein